MQVFECTFAGASAAEAAQVAADGSSIGTSMVRCVATPHFFKSGRMIILSVVDDRALLDLLKGALGEQFAGR